MKPHYKGLFTYQAKMRAVASSRGRRRNGNMFSVVVEVTNDSTDDNSDKSLAGFTNNGHSSNDINTGSGSGTGAGAGASSGVGGDSNDYGSGSGSDLRENLSIDIIHADIVNRFFQDPDDRARFEAEAAPYLRLIKTYEEREAITDIGQRAVRDPNKFFHISSYYNMLNTKYSIPIQHHNTYAASTRCDECGTPLGADFDDEVCPNISCLNRQDVMQSRPNYADKSSSLTSRATYVEQELSKATQYIQGRIGSDTIPDKLYTDFIAYCERKDIDIATVRPQLAKSIFKEIGYKNYDHMYLFLNILNGYPLIIIPEDYEAMIRQDNIAYMQEFEKIKGTRSSSPNSYFKLMLFLKRHDFDIPYEDLKLPTLPKTINDLTEISREVFSRLGWKFPAI